MPLPPNEGKHMDRGSICPVSCKCKYKGVRCLLITRTYVTEYATIGLKCIDYLLEWMKRSKLRLLWLEAQ